MDQLNVRDKTKEDTYMCATLLNMFKRGDFKKNHPLQRNANKWGKDGQDGLVVTVIRHEDIDSIKICEQIKDGGIFLWLIDGLQRFTALLSFKAGVFKLGKNIEMPIFCYQTNETDSDGNVLYDEDGNPIQKIVEYDLRGKGYNDLPDEIKERFNNCKINVTKHLDCTDDEVGYHIRRYNRQVSMNQNEIGVTYMDHVAKKVKKISRNNKFFKNCGKYSAKDQLNGGCDRVVCEAIMLMFYPDNWKKSLKDTGKFLNYYATEEQFNILDGEMNRLVDIIKEKTFTTFFTTKNSFLFFALFHNFTFFNVEDSKFVDFLSEFETVLQYKEMEEFGGVSFDSINKNRATKDRKVVECKFGILNALLKEYMDSTTKETHIVDFIAECVEVEKNVIEEDLDFYNETLDKLLLDHVMVGSRHLEGANRLSLLALVAYSYKEDIDLDQWITEYTFHNNTYDVNQKENFNKMKRDLGKYIHRLRRESA